MAACTQVWQRATRLHLTLFTAINQTGASLGVLRQKENANRHSLEQAETIQQIGPVSVTYKRNEATVKLNQISLTCVCVCVCGFNI